MPLLSGSQLLTAEPSRTSSGTSFKRPTTAAAARWCLVVVQVTVQAWMLAAYVLQVPALQDVLLMYSGANDVADPGARADISLLGGIPFVVSVHLPGSFLGFGAAFGCPDARSLAAAILEWLGLPLSSGDRQGGGGDGGGGGRGVLPPEVQLLLGLQCAVLAVAALRLKARG